MKKLPLFVIITLSFFSCKSVWEKEGYMNYTDYTEKQFNKLKSPVILIAKSKRVGDYSIVVKDSVGTIHYYGNLSGLANTIGESRQSRG